jgi:hypothetical protein
LTTSLGNVTESEEHKNGRTGGSSPKEPRYIQRERESMYACTVSNSNVQKIEEHAQLILRSSGCPNSSSSELLSVTISHKRAPIFPVSVSNLLTLNCALPHILQHARTRTLLLISSSLLNRLSPSFSLQLTIGELQESFDAAEAGRGRRRMHSPLLGQRTARTRFWLSGDRSLPCALL